MTYQVTATRTGDEWVAAVPDLDIEVTARNLETLARRVRANVAADAELDWTYDTGDPELNALTAELRARRDGIRRLADDSAAAVRRMSAEGWSVRDIGGLLGIPIQRVSQITHMTPGQPPG